jgi:transcriptional regulator GlxA family with amidase domain
MTDDAFPRLCRARDALRDVSDPPRRIRAVAREAGMSPFHFIRRFQALFGETPHQARIRFRLELAKELLAVSERSVTDVCMDVGFSSLGSFSDLFARRIGAPPSAYRRRMRSLMVSPGVLPDELTPGCLTLMSAAFATFEKRTETASKDAEDRGDS